jgi:5'-3' exonuclease
MSIALIDFSSLFHRLYHVNREEVEQKIQSFLNSLPVYDDVIICLDSPPYKRKEIDSGYKANRNAPDPELIGSLRSCIKKVSKSGYTMASCEGWEADDVIATMVGKITNESVTVYGTDKDLLQCTDLTVPFTNELKTPESTLGVPREKVVDYLCLVGDTSDNVKGVYGIGPKRAQEALAKFGSLSGLYETLKNKPSSFNDKTAEALLESLSWMDTTRQLITLNNKLDVKIEKQERVETQYFDNADPEVETQTENTIDIQSETTKQQAAIQKTADPQYIVKTEAIDYRHAIEPMGIESAYRFAQMACKSELYCTKFKGPEQHMIAIMRGRALGMDATTALDQINMIQGRPTLSAQAIIGLIKASPKCKYFCLIESTQETCTWETHRDGEPQPTRRTMTMKEASDSKFTTQPEYKWNGQKKIKTGNIVIKDKWEEMPATMLMWRCGTALGRSVYPDLINGIYSVDEME